MKRAPSFRSIHHSWQAVIVVSALAGLALPAGCRRTEGPRKPLTCHVGGTMRPVMQELAKRYEAQTGRKVDINSAGSGELLAHIQGQREGDLYVCHSPFQPILFKKYKLGVDGWTLAELTPVIVVQKGNPKKITGLKDLARPEVDLALTDFKRSSLGRMLKTIFGRAGIDLAELNASKKITINKSGGYVANLVKTKNADAAMCWNAVAHLRLDGVDMVRIDPDQLPTPGVDTVSSATGKAYPLMPVHVDISTLTCSDQPAAAKAFAEYVASAKGLAAFAEFGFTMGQSRQTYKDGKPLGLAAEPLKLMAGAGLRRAVEELIAAFEKATGIPVEPDYAGSGMLVGKVKLGAEPDLFMPGDVGYLDKVTDKIAVRRRVTWFMPTIIVAKDNPLKITSLKDFLRDDVRVALGNPRACRIGQLNEPLFKKSGLDVGKIDPNRLMLSTTVNELGVWVKTGQVDASIVWGAIAANVADATDRVEIPAEKNIISTVVVGVLKTSRNQGAARKFANFLAGNAAQRILKARGYRTEAP